MLCSIPVLELQEGLDDAFPIDLDRWYRNDFCSGEPRWEGSPRSSLD